jgi:ParE toxin of type II toxin-antitoxin system, parDE
MGEPGAGVRETVGDLDQWRVRVGDWRIVYRVDDGVLVVLVVTVAPRGRVYRSGVVRNECAPYGLLARSGDRQSLCP